MTNNPDYDHYVGRVADMPITDTMSVRVVIVDVRRAYGRTDVQVVPTQDSGSGTAWIDVRKLKVIGRG